MLKNKKCWQKNIRMIKQREVSTDRNFHRFSNKKRLIWETVNTCKWHTGPDQDHILPIQLSIKVQEILSLRSQTFTITKWDKVAFIKDYKQSKAITKITPHGLSTKKQRSSNEMFILTRKRLNTTTEILWQILTKTTCDSKDGNKRKTSTISWNIRDHKKRFKRRKLTNSKISSSFKIKLIRQMSNCRRRLTPKNKGRRRFNKRLWLLQSKKIN